jgi:S-adenosylmethionine hydrolase
MSLVTLLTDFGTADYFVGAVKGTLLRLAPTCQLVDITHQVPPGDIVWGAHVLWAAAPAFAPGTIHLAVVDPGVGGSRRILAAEANDGLYVAPDNGLLEAVLDTARVVSVARPDLYLDGPSQTFHGRDRFAPVAAFLARGGAAETLGPVVQDPVRLPSWKPVREERGARGQIVHVDRFGNLVTNIPSGWLPPGTAFRLKVGGQTELHVLASCYADLPGSRPGVVPGSLGLLEISVQGDSASRILGSERGAQVTLRLLETGSKDF